jgi:hypothetical protein
LNLFGHTQHVFAPTGTGAKRGRQTFALATILRTSHQKSSVFADYCCSPINALFRILSMQLLKFDRV